MELKKKLSQLRKDKEMTQLDLAEALNVSRQAVSRWEVGTAVPSLDNLVSLSELYGVPLDYLVRDEMEKPNLKEPETARPNQRLKLRIAYAALALCLLMTGAAIGAAAGERKQSVEALPAASFPSFNVFSMAFSEFRLHVGMGWQSAKYILKDKAPQLFPDDSKPVRLDGAVIDRNITVGYLEPVYSTEYLESIYSAGHLEPTE